MRRIALLAAALGLLVSGCAGHEELTSGAALNAAGVLEFDEGLRSVARTKDGLVETRAAQPSFADSEGTLSVVEIINARGSSEAEIGLVQGIPQTAPNSQWVALLVRPSGSPDEGDLRLEIVQAGTGKVEFQQLVSPDSTLGGVDGDEVAINDSEKGLLIWTPQGLKPEADAPPMQVVDISQGYVVGVTDKGVGLYARDFTRSYLSKTHIWGALSPNQQYLLTAGPDDSWWVYDIATRQPQELFEDLHGPIVQWLPSGRLLAQKDGKAVSCEWTGRKCFNPDPLTAGEEFGPPVAP